VVSHREHHNYTHDVISIGLIGGGNITDTHARAVRAVPGASITAICGTNIQRVRGLTGEHGGEAYTDLDAFLAHRPMDIVIVGSPSGVHATHGIAAARQGLHVLVEKPIDINTARADALIVEAEKAGVKLGVIFQDRLKPGIRRTKELVERGTLGSPILADARVKWYRPPEYYANSRWRGTWSLDGGAALINQGVHTVDLLLWLFGEVRRVQAAMRTKLHTIEAEDTLAAVLEFESGALGVLQAATSIYPGYPRRIELTGSEGTMILEQDRLIEIRLRHDEPASIFAESMDENPSPSSPVVSDHRAHQAVLEDFIRAIETNSRPVCDGREGRRSLALIESIYKSCSAA
jgi:UDP-N-acetyl-2-amino-2-deoxyglucuronate dehydrogenase